MDKKNQSSRQPMNPLRTSLLCLLLAPGGCANEYALEAAPGSAAANQPVKERQRIACEMFQHVVLAENNTNWRVVV
ncbi:hypothetical protein AVMA1855_08925 [Acidovorax sp. SUPP1855]|uniref:hypothetical protein n=1 Tax=Acidovorax sp. SUPP1855 TaxID=431774 RepID=UPI0023DE2EED|nr:hypothetical protein [Acidovorax sp. SUPP1855]GKS84259.1 hypothetical protein AVMA1855_08925 [Acidovorax sp. SUPP1855]